MAPGAPRILRAWLDRHLPEARAFARQQGFKVPIAAWIARRGEQLGPLIAADPAVAEVCPPDAVIALYRKQGKREGFAARTLLFDALWHRAHIRGLDVSGNVFDARAAAG